MWNVQQFVDMCRLNNKHMTNLLVELVDPVDLACLMGMRLNVPLRFVLFI